MKIFNTSIEGLLIMKNKIYEDKRGYFQEVYHKEKFCFLPPKTNFVQDNLSVSKKNVIRGIHIQQKYPQGKLLKVIKGSIFDVAVDLRPNSKTFCKYYALILSEKNYLQFWIPEGFGHGFLSLEDDTIVQYKCSQFYLPEYEKTILWNDKDLNIDWPYTEDCEISLKDQNGITLQKYLSS